MIAKSDAASIFLGTQGSRSIEISVPGAFTAVGFSGQQKNPGASAAERGRPSLFKTIDEDQRQRHDHINRSDRSTYPGRISVLTSGATPPDAESVSVLRGILWRRKPAVERCYWVLRSYRFFWKASIGVVRYALTRQKYRFRKITEHD